MGNLTPGTQSVMVAEVHLIRHGETRWSLSGQHTGRTDLPLTERGEQRARYLGQLLRGIAFSEVLVSPLQRARRTCELAGLSAAAHVQENLSEWDYGDYEGLTPVQVHAQRPDWDVFRDGCPGGESPEQVAARAGQVIAEVRAIDGRVAIFSHGHFLRVLAVRWIDLPMRLGRQFSLETGSLSILGYEQDDAQYPTIRLWNAVSNDAFDLEPHRI
jgi:broad specificity phosphatase PhoE